MPLPKGYILNSNVNPVEKRTDYSRNLPPGYTLKPQTQIDAEYRQQLPDAARAVATGGRGLLDIVAQEGPQIIGAIGGGVAGIPAGPPGIFGGAMLGAAGAEAAAQLMRVGLGQPQVPHGSTLVAPETPAGRIAEAGLMGGMQEAGTAIRSTIPVLKRLPKAFATPFARLGQEFNVPMTRAQRLQENVPISQAMEGYLRGSLIGSTMFRRFDQKVAGRLTAAADRLLTSIDKNAQTPKQFGEMLGESIQAFEKMRSRSYDAALQDLSKRGGADAPVNVPKYVVATAQDLLDKTSLKGDYEEILKAGGDAESLNFAIKRLEMLAEPNKPVAGALIDTSAGAVPQMEPKTMTFEEARKLRSILFDLSNRGESNIGKGAIKKFNESLTEGMGDALNRFDTSPKKELWTNFNTVSANYRDMKETLKNQITSKIIKSDRPATLISEFMKGDPESAIALFSKIAPTKKSSIARAVFQQAWDTSVKERIPVSNGFDRVWYNYPKGAKNALFGDRPDLLEKINRFAKLVDTMGLSPNLASSTSSQVTGLFGKGQAAILVGSVAGFAINPSIQGVAGGASTILLAPMMLAYIATRPAATDIVKLAARTSASSPAAPQIAARLFRLFAEIPKEVKNESQATAPWTNYVGEGKYPRVTSPSLSPATSTATPPVSPYPQLQQLLQQR